MNLVKLPSHGRWINMERVTEVLDNKEVDHEERGPRLTVLFGQRDATHLYGADRAALLRYLGRAARDLELEEDEEEDEDEDEEDDLNAEADAAAAEIASDVRRGVPDW